MAIYTIADDLADAPFTLIAIHTALPDYKLAYYFNRDLKIQLHRLSYNIPFKQAEFSIYEWYNVLEDTFWHLIKNKAVVEQDTAEASTLFSNQQTLKRSVNLVPECKQADYVLKIDNGENTFKYTRQVLATISQIPQIVTCYEIATDQLKSKDQLNYMHNARQKKN